MQYNDSDQQIEQISSQENLSAGKATNSGMELDVNEDESTWFTVQRHIRRYKASILGINVSGSNETQKLNSLNNRLAGVNGFIECKKFVFQRNLWITAIFDDKKCMLDACNKELFEGNDHKLSPIINRGDDKTKKRMLIIRNLPLDTDRNLL